MVDYRLWAEVSEKLFPELTEIYRQVFTPPPYNKGEESILYFEKSLPVHVRRHAFRMIAAYVDKRLVGFAYGYTTTPDHHWHLEVVQWMTLGSAIFWLADAFQIAEIAVLPDYRGRGIGGSLHDRILLGLPHRTAVLSTLSEETNASHLYRRRGWEILVEKLTPPGMAREYHVMGLRLGEAEKR